MTAFLYRMARKPEFTSPAVSLFADIAPGDQFYKEIIWFAASGISTGRTEPNEARTFRPLESINRDAIYHGDLVRLDGGNNDGIVFESLC